MATWCTTCGSRHDVGPDCPGELLATGEERAGWRVCVLTPSHSEEYGVLVAASGKLWRARIVTYPNMLWVVPRGRGTMKFIGRTAAEAEKRASDYVMQVCRAKGYRVVDDPTKRAQHPRVPAEQEQGAAGSGPTRVLHTVGVRYGEETADRSATTQDLSDGGLFIVTGNPLPVGTRLRLVVEIGETSIPLHGVVAWVRSTPEPGRQVGMGLQLLNPPALYRHYVEKLGGSAANRDGASGRN